MWAEAGEATKGQGTDRSTIIREFLHWYLRKPGAKLPQRPGRAK
jgi:hypothetical protein